MRAIQRAVALGWVGMLAVAGRAGAMPTAAEEAAELPAKIADATGPDAAKRALATEWLMNTTPQTLPLIEKAAAELKADAKADPAAAARLEAVLTVLKPLDEVRLAEAAQIKSDGEWNRRTALAAYDQFGNRNPKWDAAAREALAQVTSTDGPEHAKAAATLKHLADLQCADPLIAYYIARSIDKPPYANGVGQRADKAYQYSAFLYEHSNYPADRKIMPLGRLMNLYKVFDLFEQVPAARPMIQKNAAAALALWPQVVAEPGLPFDYAYAAGLLVLDGQAQIGVDRKAALDQVLPLLAKVYPNEPGLKVFEGVALTDWAWDARGDGYANSVTPQRWAKFRDRLAAADKVLEAAWAANPNDPGAPIALMTVGLGQQWPAAKMDLWFRRALAAHPDMTPTRYDGMDTPYDARVMPMLPKWGGSDAEMVAFGRRLLAGRNWRGLIPYQLAAIHSAIAAESGRPGAYFRRPDVWADLDKLTAEPLRVWPDDVGYQSARAYFAWKCGQWKIADAMFKQLGDRCVPAMFGGPDGLAGAKASTAAGLASQTPGAGE